MTAIGLVFAVLTERIRWAVAFKTAVFMPMAISLFAAGVIWRIMDEKDPDLGAVNAAIKVGRTTRSSSPGVLSHGAAVDRRRSRAHEQGAPSLKTPLAAGAASRCSA